eukprot:TRINITY_DN76079_c0_g1_i1.p2 TRINITY_DN76079_c0_g1~~TRINITY_DN76079_c0_g1_i1.p2  ORF type:complete len:275 (-),score=101.53 TRINITY_DN76079_c0_g1_i1:220-1044(-)
MALRARAQKALNLMDFTTLADDDTNERIEKLCADAKTAFGCTAAVCIYPQFVPVAKKALKANGTPQVRIATVVNFPHGNDDIEVAVKETKAAVAAGADEIDVVLPYKRLIAEAKGESKGGSDVCKELVSRVKKECTGDVLLKVIIESGELKEPELIKKASELSIEAGADFIKTSTGKVKVNATLETAEIMMKVIRDMGVKEKVGFKPAGGVKSAEDAKAFLDLAESLLGADWADARHFRFGASSLRPALLKALEGDAARERSRSPRGGASSAGY